jgi:hypothetical protein
MDPIWHEHNIDSPMQRLKGGWWEDMCMLMWNIKPNIFGNGKKNIPNNMMNNSVFPLVVGTSQKVYPHWTYKLETYALG